MSSVLQPGEKNNKTTTSSWENIDISKYIFNFSIFDRGTFTFLEKNNEFLKLNSNEMAVKGASKAKRSFPFNTSVVRFQNCLEVVGPRPAGLCLYGYMVNHRLTVRPQPLRLMAPERRAVHCYYVAHRSIWLIIGSARVIQLLKLCLQAFDCALYTIAHPSYRTRTCLSSAIRERTVYIGSRLKTSRTRRQSYESARLKPSPGRNVSEFNKIRDVGVTPGQSVETSREDNAESSQKSSPLQPFFSYFFFFFFFFFSLSPPLLFSFFPAFFSLFCLHSLFWLINPFKSRGFMSSRGHARALYFSPRLSLFRSPPSASSFNADRLFRTVFQKGLKTTLPYTVPRWFFVRSVHIQMIGESIRQPSRDRIGHAKVPSQLKLHPPPPLEFSSILCLLSPTISWRTNEAPSCNDARISSLYIRGFHAAADNVNRLTRVVATPVSLRNVTRYRQRGHKFNKERRRNVFYRKGPATRFSFIPRGDETSPKCRRGIFSTCLFNRSRH